MKTKSKQFFFHILQRFFSFVCLFHILKLFLWNRDKTVFHVIFYSELNLIKKLKLVSQNVRVREREKVESFECCVYLQMVKCGIFFFHFINRFRLDYATQVHSTERIIYHWIGFSTVKIKINIYFFWLSEFKIELKNKFFIYF
jgi:hypothetical protein